MPEKTVKVTAKSPAKVFDVAKPARQVPADANSRPVIVSNRPIMQDPMMLNQEAAAESSSKPSSVATKVVIKPLTESEKQDEEKPSEPQVVDQAEESPDEAVAAKKSDNPLAGLPVITLDDLPLDNTSAKPKATAKESSEPDVSKEAEVKQSETAPAATDDTSKVDKTTEPKPLPKSKSETPPTAEKVAEPAVPSPLDSIAASVDAPKGDKAALELETEAKQQNILDELVENKTYFLPLNSVEKRRDKIVAGLGVLLIVALGFLLLDLLMDVGAVQISGIEPPIKFFSK